MLPQHPLDVPRYNWGMLPSGFLDVTMVARRTRLEMMRRFAPMVWSPPLLTGMRPPGAEEALDQQLCPICFSNAFPPCIGTQRTRRAPAWAT